MGRRCRRCSCHQPAMAGIFWFGVAESVTWCFRLYTNILYINKHISWYMHIFHDIYIHSHVLHTYLETWFTTLVHKLWSIDLCHSTPQKKTVAVVGASCRIFAQTNSQLEEISNLNLPHPHGFFLGISMCHGTINYCLLLVFVNVNS